MIVSKRGFVLWAALAAASMLIVVLARRQIDLSRAKYFLATRLNWKFSTFSIPILCVIIRSAGPVNIQQETAIKPKCDGKSNARIG